MLPVRSSEQLLQHQGQGDAYIFNPTDFSALNHFISANKADKMAREKALADRDADLEEKLKYNPKAIHAPYQQEQQQKYNNLLNMKANLLRNHVYDSSHPDRIAYENAKNELEQDVAKANDIMGAYQTVSGQIQKDPYLKQEQAQRAANDLLHDESGTSRLPIREVNPEALAKVTTDPQHFNLQSYGGDVAKDTAESVRSYLHNERMMGGQRTNEDIVKSKFHMYDDNGKLITDEKGQPVVNITPETKSLFFGKDPRARAAVDYEINKQNQEITAYNSMPENKNNQKPLVTEDDVVRQYLSPYAYSNVNKNIGTLNKPNEGKGGAGSEEFKTTTVYNTKRKTTSLSQGGQQEVQESPIDTEIRLTGKKMDTPLYVRGVTIYDEDNNKALSDKESLGDVEIRPTRLMFVPKDTKTGQYLTGDQKDIDRHKNPVKYEWVLGGVIKGKDKKADKHIYVPYDQVKNDLTAEYGEGVNLDNRNYSQLSDRELAQLIDEENTDLSREDKIQLFKQIRSQK